MPIFPAGGGGPNSGPGLNPVLQYCSPSGNNGNDGLTWSSAKLTPDACLTYLASHGGGELHYAEGVLGDIWLRGDGLTVPGFHSEMPLRVTGHGSVASQFGDPVAWLQGGAWTGGGRLHPLIWLVACNSRPIILENITPSAGGIPGIGLNNQTLRIGWDYRRKSDGSINWANVSTWNRTSGGDGGSATLTLALPAATPMTSAVRTGSTVRVTWASKLPLPADVSFTNAAKAQWVYINSTDPAYASGSFKVTAVDPSGSETLWFEYTDASSGSTTPMSPLGTYQSSGVCINDRIEVVSTETNVPSCMYKVWDATSATSIKVIDNYGYGGRSVTGTWNNIGTYVLQDRSTWYSSSLYTVRNCQGSPTTVAADRFENGPSVDCGSVLDGRVRFEITSFNGMASDATVNCRDPDRGAWMLQDGGVRGVPAAFLRGDRPNGGGIRIYGSNVATWGINAKDIEGDVGVGSDAPPAIETFNGNAAGIVYCDNVTNADAPDDVPNIRLDSGMLSADVRIKDCGLVEGRGYIDGGISPAAWTTRTEIPQVQSQHGFWQYGNVAGKISGVARLLGGLATAKAKNLALVPASWTLNGSTMTTGQADPFGGTQAVNLTGVHNVEVYSGTHAVAVGDKWLYGVWMKRTGGITAGPVGVITLVASPAVTGWAATANVEFKGDGEWQFIYVVADSAGSQASTTVTATISVAAGTCTVFEPTVLPMGDMTPNQWAYEIENFRAQANYLPAGMDGTGVGRKFCAHGGIATVVGAKTLGASNGVTVPFYDQAGVLKGYIELKDEA